ncbi:MAG: alpha/beta fold hydrolase [Planctomycetota bacterium]|nr:alpha/beta fold hydrolase [Planctomycetota bacterium]
MLSPLPFPSRWQAIGPHRLHYVDEGGGEILVLLHGNPTWSFYYRRLIEALRRDYRVIALDHMGMGLSDKPQDYPYTLQTHIENFTIFLSAVLPSDASLTLLCHDWGGAIGMGYAVNHPERIQRLVIFNSAAFLSRRIPIPLRLARTPIIGAVLIRGFNLFARGALRWALAEPGRLAAAARAGYLFPYDSWRTRVGIYRFVRDIPVNAKVPSHSVIQAIDERLSRLAKKPVLLQWGARDWCFDREFLAAWQRRFPHAEVDVYDNAGHYVVEEAGDAIAMRLRRFFATAGPSSRERA